MTTTSEWDRWQTQWRATGTPPDNLTALIVRARRARRSVVLIRWASAAMALFAMAVVGAALSHAGNGFEIALGVVVAAGIAAVWGLDVVNGRRAGEKLEAPEGEYRAARRALCRRQAQFARIGWIVAALDLVFLVPWWIGGFAVHGAGFHLAQVLTMWGPLGIMTVFVAWTVTLGSRARAELRQIARANSPVTSREGRTGGGSAES